MLHFQIVAQCRTIKTRPDGETDITRRFGRRVLGSIPGRGTRIESRRRVIMSPVSGYGSVVEQLVANQLTRVRFSLPAPKKTGDAYKSRVLWLCTKLCIVGIKDTSHLKQ